MWEVMNPASLLSFLSLSPAVSPSPYAKARARSLCKLSLLLSSLLCQASPPLLLLKDFVPSVSDFFCTAYYCG